MEVWRRWRRKRRIKVSLKTMLPQGAWVNIVGFVRQAKTSHVQGLFD